MAILETPRLILRPFDEKDVDQMSELMANPDFMRFSLGPKTHEQTAAFLETVIPRSVRLSEAPSFGKSILEYAPNGAAAIAYRALAREFLKRHDSSATAPESGRTLESENL